jgi:hypothetical protein
MRICRSCAICSAVDTRFLPSWFEVYEVCKIRHVGSSAHDVRGSRTRLFPEDAVVNLVILSRKWLLGQVCRVVP